MVAAFVLHLIATLLPIFTSLLPRFLPLLTAPLSRFVEAFAPIAAHVRVRWRLLLVAALVLHLITALLPRFLTLLAALLSRFVEAFAPIAARVRIPRWLLRDRLLVDQRRRNRRPTLRGRLALDWSVRRPDSSSGLLGRDRSSWIDMRRGPAVRSVRGQWIGRFGCLRRVRLGRP
jgi:hypothetical protein